MDRAAWDEGALVVAAGDLAIGADADAVGRAQSGGVALESRTILADADDRTVVFAHAFEAAPTASDRCAEGEVEPAGRVGVQVEAKRMEAAGQIPVVVEVLVEIRFPIIVIVVKACDLHVADRVDDIVDDFQAERFVQTRGEAFPLDLTEFIVDAGDDPHITIPG